LISRRVALTRSPRRLKTPRQRLLSGRSAVLFACPATDDFFRSRIDRMIDLRRPLAALRCISRLPVLADRTKA
jgi:hypothetical protein